MFVDWIGGDRWIRLDVYVVGLCDVSSAGYAGGMWGWCRCSGAGGGETTSMYFWCADGVVIAKWEGVLTKVSGSGCRAPPIHRAWARL